MHARTLIRCSRHSAGWILCAASGLAMIAGEAAAAPARFVASNGDDANNCSVSAPCRTLQRGVEATPAGGTLFVKDTGNYGTSLTIAKTIVIAAEDVSATLTGAGGIVIDNNSAVVTIRGLQLTGEFGGTGIHIVQADAVHIEECAIGRFIVGVQLDSPADLFISDTVSRDHSADGLRVLASGPTTRVTIHNSRFENNGDDGMSIVGTRSTVANSIASGNSGTGIEADSSRMNISGTTAANNGGSGFAVLGADGQMSIESSVARENGSAGLFVQSGAEARISDSAFTHNSIGVNNLGATLSRNNNTIIDNGDDEAGNAIGDFNPS